MADASKLPACERCRTRRNKVSQCDESPQGTGLFLRRLSATADNQHALAAAEPA